MIIKTFKAESSATALKMVRGAMGGDAVVLKTTQIVGPDNKRYFEVTACLENPTVDQSNKIFADTKPEKVGAEAIADKVSIESTLKELETPAVTVLTNRIQQDMENDRKKYYPFEHIHESLTEHDFDKEFINEFMDELISSYISGDDVNYFAETRLVAKLSEYFSPEYKCTTGNRIALIGPAGSGKSSVMGKFASNLVIREKQKIMLVTLDDVKMGAFDETTAYAEILGAEYADSRTSTEELKQHTDMITLIDTVAMPVIRENLYPIAEKLDSIETTERIGVFSATMRSRDVAAFKEHIQILGATKLIITMTDMTSCIGSLITAAYHTGLPIIYTTESQGGVGQLHTPDPSKLAKMILPLEVVNE